MIKKNIFFLLLFYFLITAIIYSKNKYPDLIENLIMPSGFDNEYVKKLKNNEEIEFVKPILRIMDFKISKSFYNGIKKNDINVSDILKSKISDTGRYILLGSDDDLNTIFKEQLKLGYDDFSDDTDLEMGNLRIASYVLRGSITQAFHKVKQEGGVYYLRVTVGTSITISDANTGVIEYTKNMDSIKEEKLMVTAEGMIVYGPRNLIDKPLNTLNATGEDVDLSPQYYEAFEESLSNIVHFIEETYPIMGEVIDVQKNQVIITISQKQGIKSGDFIFIIRTGEPLEDNRGKFLGFSKEMIGACQIMSVEKNMSAANIIKLAKWKIKPEKGDIVISVPANIK